MNFEKETMCPTILGAQYQSNPVIEIERIWVGCEMIDFRKRRGLWRPIWVESILPKKQNIWVESRQEWENKESYKIYTGKSERYKFARELYHRIHSRKNPNFDCVLFTYLFLTDLPIFWRFYSILPQMFFPYSSFLSCSVIILCGNHQKCLFLILKFSWQLHTILQSWNRIVFGNRDNDIDPFLLFN